MRHCLQFAGTFPNIEIVNTLCSKLSWSHLRILTAIDDPLKREFYIEIAQLERWSVRQLQERINSMLFERTALSRKPEETIRHDLEQLRQTQQVSPDILLKDTSFWSPDGKPMSAAEFVQRLFGEIPELFTDEDELRAIWSRPDTRRALLEGLAEKGYGEEQLTEISRLIDAEKSDLFI